VSYPWDESRRAFADAADWFVRTTAAVGNGWAAPALGEWDVRALVGHTSRSLLTVEEYLARPAASIDIPTTADYFRATRELARGDAVAQRGRDAGDALGSDPVAGVAALAARVVPVVLARDGTELMTTIAGGIRLADYLPTRTFELTVHTADLAAALDLPLSVPPTAAAQALRVVGDLAVGDGTAGPVLLALTGRRGLPARFSLL
jgi:hypothetical protein